jgi:hypothetical protein
MPSPDRKTPVIPLVSEQHFVLATRDTGYRTTAAALAELIDNSVQAGATTVRVVVDDSPESGLSVAILDNGCGMDAAVLRTALQFGGTTRFNDRSGPGRYGMGLPNSSVSQARRVEVYSWSAAGRVIHTYLDVDDIAAGRVRGIPNARPRELPDWARQLAGATGTLVQWFRCDRLEGRRISTIVRHLHRDLGRRFRYFLWRKATLTINGDAVQPIDPLFLHKNSVLVGGVPYGEPLLYHVRRPTDPADTATITVRFVELPVSAWHDMSVADKRRFAVVKSAGVSVVRASREVSYGWHFMGRKRKENYDDWWRCEVSFDPALDEYFGLTHSKQAISPTPEIETVLVPDIEAIAHKLNARVRSAFAAVRARAGRATAQRATVRELQLPPLHRDARRDLRPADQRTVSWRDATYRYRLVIERLTGRAFYSCELRDGELVVIVNREHPFFDKLYCPLVEDAAPVLARRLEYLLLALGRSEIDAPHRLRQYWYRRKRLTWSDALAALLKGS